VCTTEYVVSSCRPAHVTFLHLSPFLAGRAGPVQKARLHASCKETSHHAQPNLRWYTGRPIPNRDGAKRSNGEGEDPRFASARCNLHPRNVFLMPPPCPDDRPLAPGYPVAISRSVVGATSNQDCAAPRLCQTRSGAGDVSFVSFVSFGGLTGGRVSFFCSHHHFTQGWGRERRDEGGGMSFPPLSPQRLLAGNMTSRDRQKRKENNTVSPFSSSPLLHSTLYPGMGPALPPQQTPETHEQHSRRLYGHHLQIHHLSHPTVRAATHEPRAFSFPSPQPSAVPFPPPAA